MRQVPDYPTYLLIGGGRLGRHLAHYLRLLNVSFLQWKRFDQSVPELIQMIEKQNTILLCIKDDQIETFYESFGRPDRTFVHFSGTFSYPPVLGFHPLMSFGQSLYDQELYEQIHFVGAEKEALFRQIFPKLTNAYSEILESQKSLYHSLCVLSGNGTTLLWDLISQEFAKLGLPQQALAPYFRQVARNIEENQPGRWTGPWYRHDKQTILKNQQALTGKLLENLYTEFEKLSHFSGHNNEKRH